MGYVRNKTKTNRHAKCTKKNKRNARKQTFRKSRRVNRGGKGTEKRSHDDEGYDNEGYDNEGYDNVKRIRKETMEEKMRYNKENNNNNRHHQEQIEQYSKQDAEIAKKAEFNKMMGSYREPLYPNANDVRVDQTEDLENTKKQNEQNDRNSGLWFGGKKQRAIKRK